MSQRTRLMRRAVLSTLLLDVLLASFAYLLRLSCCASIRDELVAFHLRDSLLDLFLLVHFRCIALVLFYYDLDGYTIKQEYPESVCSFTFRNTFTIGLPFACLTWLILRAIILLNFLHSAPSYERTAQALGYLYFFIVQQFLFIIVELSMHFVLNRVKRSFVYMSLDDDNNDNNGGGEDDDDDIRSPGTYDSYSAPTFSAMQSPQLKIDPLSDVEEDDDDLRSACNKVARLSSTTNEAVRQSLADSVVAAARAKAASMPKAQADQLMDAARALAAATLELEAKASDAQVREALARLNQLTTESEQLMSDNEELRRVPASHASGAEESDSEMDVEEITNSNAPNDYEELI